MINREHVIGEFSNSAWTISRPDLQLPGTSRMRVASPPNLEGAGMVEPGPDRVCVSGASTRPGRAYLSNTGLSPRGAFPIPPCAVYEI